MKTHSRIGRVHLKVKGRGLDSLLLLASQSGKAVGKSVCDTEVQNAPTKYISNYSTGIGSCGSELKLTGVCT